ncbi:hypothetical protein AGABI2DRAFT_191143 [Agaricus bisporus var. bisporus H97]|uniref:hypothetical protein n=1 Tax=Agaricus bisporus var. bisporus (strain H97 / ATCC MYA-4626 / FGSC 10389) TaxID=936046 RepID=UPI00029F7B06|nr:hypothetical protein AGABI2DRAFT_191143 [Agaricus bisporus var. bisporus H97]EKV48986.1 hypothetical protein AGABI2DRAFT_191143 [Agaricus bisporus var. bisporus H97]
MLCPHAVGLHSGASSIHNSNYKEFSLDTGRPTQVVKAQNIPIQISSPGPYNPRLFTPKTTPLVVWRP